MTSRRDRMATAGVSARRAERRTPATVTVVGGGRLGVPLARALTAAGVRVVGPLGRGEVIDPSGVVLLCVPDAEIARVAGDLKAGDACVGHTSGATSLVSSGVDFSVHPLQTFIGDERPESFRGIGCAVAGNSPRTLEIARDLALLLGTRPFEIMDQQRAGYHASASLASNLLLCVLSAAEQLAVSSGISVADARMLLAPLVGSTVENWTRVGAPAALTGPLVRGDTETVARQREAVNHRAPELLPLFDAAYDSARTLVGKRRAAT